LINVKFVCADTRVCALTINKYGGKIKKRGKSVQVSRKVCIFAAGKNSISINNMVAAAYKNRTRDEIIAAVRESIRKKQEWMKQSDEEFQRIREERKRLAV